MDRLDVFFFVNFIMLPVLKLHVKTLLGFKILGFPVQIDSRKYARNAFYFNLCFVCDSWARTVHYEPVVKKLADYLIAMELENGFLSNQEKPGKLIVMLRQVMDDINSQNMCTLTEGTTITHLKVVKVADDPPPVLDHLVPIFSPNKDDFVIDQWDLTTHQVYPYIDGFNHVAKIAAEADVENNLVKACVQNLLYYGVVALIPIFQYSNVYTATPKLKNLASNEELQRQCIAYVSKSARTPATLRDIFRMYSSMTYGTTVKDLCIRFNPNSLHINERKLVQFGVLEGFIRRVYKYPIVCGDSSSSESEDNLSTLSQLQGNFIGVSSTDEICCTNGISSQQLEDILERDPNIYVIWK
ncbi:GATOR complex protein NPRL2 isoform X2 [Chrysoperla carnea]|uniref:GATOR complex protein NPRL2 isoform X2 n=1 Tax=Chrysoperla carnea TaxID=189513 RepID=UPI001D081E86|nr:GATOR complex protein NPRL2 isoform X2 [Chrysoperla carnea]